MMLSLKNIFCCLATTGLFVLLPQVAAGQDVSLRNNLLYDATGTLNAAVEVQVGDHLSLGVNGGFKSWPRFLIWDTDTKTNTTHWRHFLVAPEARFYFGEVFKGFFAGGDLLYIHYNVGNVKLPLGLFPEIRDYRLQGNYYAVGLFAGYAWRLGPHWRIEALAGMHVGYAGADKYECAHCGAQVGTMKGVSLLPNLGVNIAYNFKRREQREKKKEEILEIVAPMKDTLVPPVVVPEPAPFEPASFKVEEWKGVAGELAPKHPVLRPSSEYKPYTPDRILRKEEGALYVFYELGKADLKRSFSESGLSRDNGPVLDEIMDITAGILKDTTSSVSCIQIVGLASIDGSVLRNQSLADNRARALQAYIQDRLNVSDVLFETVGGGEAWTEFRDAVNDLVLAGGGAGLTVTQLQKVLDIIDGEPNPYNRESRLKALENGAVYQQLKRHVLADLRNSGYIRVYFDYVPDENARIINSAIDAIEAGEMDKARIIAATVKDDPRASVVLECLEAYEQHQQQEEAYQKYLMEFNEYNNLIINK